MTRYERTKKVKKIKRDKIKKKFLIFLLILFFLQGLTIVDESYINMTMNKDTKIIGLNRLSAEKLSFYFLGSKTLIDKNELDSQVTYTLNKIGNIISELVN